MAGICTNNNFMKKFFTLLLLSCFGITLFAQFPGGGQRGGQGRGGGQSMNVGHFYGKIVDKKTSKGISAASVQLIQAKMDSTQKTKDVIVSGMLTKSNGDFSLENLPVMGKFRLTITAIGFKPLDRPIAFEIKMGGAGGAGGMEQALAAVDKDLGNIKMEQDAQVLEGVTVTTTKPLFTMGVDRKIFNVEKNLVSSGQTAQELMKSIPSINVDIDGNVTLRNAAPQIFVDGRPSTLTLDQIPADAIESVEIITNPSAKYDASGGNAGILNIVLKKNRKAGYNGNIRAGVDSRGKFNGGGDINVKQGKVNFFASANVNQRKSLSTSNIFRHNLTKPLVDVNQNSDGVNNGSFAFGRAGFDYLIDNRNTLSFSGVIVNGSFKNRDNLNFDSISSRTIYTHGNQLTETKVNFKNYGASVNFKHVFAKAGKDVTADLNYNTSRNNNTGQYTTNLYQPDYTIKGSPLLRQLDGNGANKFFTAQVDYTDPISEHAKIETGARVAVRDNASVSNNSFYNYSTNRYEINSLLSTDYKFTDRVYAGYFNFINKINTWSYQAGLRAESSDYTGTLLSTKSSFSTKYPISLFPSVFITKELKNNQDIQLNYSRRVNRPNFFQLIPYTDISDPQNYTRGNPALKPEFTNSFEMSYQKTFPKNHSLLVTAYYKNSTNLITRYTYRDKVTETSSDSAYFTTYLNANSSTSYGLEFTTRNPITRWWDMITNFNFYNSKINGSNIDKSLQSERLSYFVKWNNNIKLPANFSFQFSGDYQSKSVLPQSSGGGGRGGGGGGGFGGGGYGGGVQPTAQGYVNANYGFDAAIKKEFLKNKAASLTLSINDIFKTKKYSYYSESTFFTQTSSRRRDAQVFRLNFNYRFGKIDVSLFKRKNMKGGMDTPDVPGQ